MLVSHDIEGVPSFALAHQPSKPREQTAQPEPSARTP